MKKESPDVKKARLEYEAELREDLRAQLGECLKRVPQKVIDGDYMMAVRYGMATEACAAAVKSARIQKMRDALALMQEFTGSARRNAG